MIRSDLVDFFGKSAKKNTPAILGMTAGTVGERAKACVAAGLIGVGKQGTAGARMKSRDAINLLLACVIEHRYGENIADNVRRVRELPADSLVELPLGLTKGLRCFTAQKAGDALDWLLDDIRTDRLTTWARGEKWTATVSFVTSGAAVYFSFHWPEWRYPREFHDAGGSFRLPGYNSQEQMVERQLSINVKEFVKLAEALGPPD